MNYNKKTVLDVDVSGKKVLLRCDFNVPMAKGGSGDVLTGLLTGLLAQGMEPFDACCAAVWIHGRAGDMAAEEKGRRGMTPADMIEKLPYALKEVE